MDARKLRYFLAVAEHGSITAAADACFIAQPALSQTVRGLEQELEVELFRRVPRGMTLTAAGEALLGPAERIAEGMAEVREAVRGVTELRGGALDIIAPADLALDPLASFVARFRAAYPGVRVTLLDAREDEDVAEALRGARCEVGFAHLPLGRGGKVTVRPSGRRELLLALPPGHPGGRKGVVPLGEVADVPLILPPKGTALRELVEQAWAGLGAVPRVVIEAEHQANVHRLVLVGAGAAFVPPALAVRCADGGSVVVRTTPGLEREFGLVHRDAPLSSAARAFVGLVTGQDGPRNGGGGA